MKNVNLTGNQIFDNMKNAPTLYIHKFLNHLEFYEKYLRQTDIHTKQTFLKDEWNQKTIFEIENLQVFN